MRPATKVLIACLYAAAAQPSVAATPAPALQQSVRAATFEVVVPKLERDPLSYERPPPLDLLPYSVRSDRYWSIGTAFAITPTQYVSAGHVFQSAIGSTFGVPALRDAAGKVYAIDRIVGYSAHEDYIVFTLANAPPAKALPTSAEYKVDSPVFAVGNALGEGVVIRDGLLTSETPEAQDGRWKWLRFSAAASPGNSGGPLLDETGRAIGVVLAKSESENLNYALPIARALAGIGQPGSIDVRYAAALPNAKSQRVSRLTATVPLPATFPDFARAVQDEWVRTNRADRAALAAAPGADLFPAKSARAVLGSTYDGTLPAIVQQRTDGSWEVDEPGGQREQPLEPGGLVEVGIDLGVTLFRVRRPNAASDDAFYSDPRAAMDLLLKGLQFHRPVGTQSVLVTSLGQPLEESVHVDRFGRRWQVRRWPVGFVDASILTFSLPTPEGFSGFAAQVPSSMYPVQLEALRYVTDYVYCNYSGTPAQWAAFLRRRELRPAAFEKVRVEHPSADAPLLVATPRFEVRVPKAIQPVGPDSMLTLRTGYVLTAGRIEWDVVGLKLRRDEQTRQWLTVGRRVRPDTDAPAADRDAWRRRVERTSGFDGTISRASDGRSLSLDDVVTSNGTGRPPPDTNVLYEVGMTSETARLPRDLEDPFVLLLTRVKVLEK